MQPAGYFFIIQLSNSRVGELASMVFGEFRICLSEIV